MTQLICIKESEGDLRSDSTEGTLNLACGGVGYQFQQNTWTQPPYQ